jgi:hypothetical protein
MELAGAARSGPPASAPPLLRDGRDLRIRRDPRPAARTERRKRACRAGPRC